MTHLGYLVAVPQVADVFMGLVATLADTPPERIVAVEPALTRWRIHNPELVATVPTVMPHLRPLTRLYHLLANEPPSLVILVVSVVLLGQTSGLPFGQAGGILW
ncbi:hypothetical protein EG335_21200 [Pectobacterium versatile]|nr:hypothetical protein EG335_21200 [Pectobacterium versatile]